MDTGDLISMYRKQAGMTIDELAEKSGVPKGTLNKIIGGVTKAPTLENMKAIARALGKTLADFDDQPAKQDEDCCANNSLSPTESALVDGFRSLNDEGQEKVIAYVNDLIQTGIYKNGHSAGVVSKEA